MTGKACVLVILSILWITPSFAQAAVGGPKKSQNYIGGPVTQHHSYIGGPVTQKNPVVPPRQGEVVRTGQPTPRPPKR
jgi:hypothetical protein